MSFFRSFFARSLVLSFALLFSKTNVFVSSFFLSLCLCVRVSSNSLNEVFLHTQIKKIQKDEQQSRFNYILHQTKPFIVD